MPSETWKTILLPEHGRNDKKLRLRIQIIPFNTYSKSHTRRKTWTKRNKAIKKMEIILLCPESNKITMEIETLPNRMTLPLENISRTFLQWESVLFHGHLLHQHIQWSSARNRCLGKTEGIQVLLLMKLYFQQLEFVNEYTPLVNWQNTKKKQ